MPDHLADIQRHLTSQNSRIIHFLISKIDPSLVNMKEKEHMALDGSSPESDSEKLKEI
jgi:hypothetical protein